MAVRDLPGHVDVLVDRAAAAPVWQPRGRPPARAPGGAVTKGSRASCNTGMAHGGIQAAVGPRRLPERHAQDVLSSSHGTADPELVSVLTSEAPEAIGWLESIGVEFSRDGGGYRLARCGGASVPRLLQVGDRTGHVDREVAAAELDRRGIAIHDHTAARSASSAPTATSRRRCAAATTSTGSTPARSSWPPAAAATPRPATPAS